MKKQKEESQKKLLIFLLVVTIIGLSGWLITDLYKYTRSTSSTKTTKNISKPQKEESNNEKEKEKPKEVDELEKLTNKMMLPFIEYNRYIISDEMNNYYFKNDEYTFDTISDEEKVAIAIIIYQDKTDYPESMEIPSYRVRKTIKDYFGKEMINNLPEKVTLQHTGETYKLTDGKYTLYEDGAGLAEMSNRIEQKIVKKELINEELIVSVNFVYIRYAQGVSFENPDEVRSNIYTDFNQERTLIIDVDFDEESNVVKTLLDGNKTYTYKYHFKKNSDNNYTFDKIQLEKS